MRNFQQLTRGWEGGRERSRREAVINNGRSSVSLLHRYSERVAIRRGKSGLIMVLGRHRFIISYINHAVFQTLYSVFYSSSLTYCWISERQYFIAKIAHNVTLSCHGWNIACTLVTNGETNAHESSEMNCKRFDNSLVRGLAFAAVNFDINSIDFSSSSTFLEIDGWLN